MAKAIAFIVTFEGAAFEVPEAGFSDLVAFEKQFGLPASVLDVETEPVIDPETGSQAVDDKGEPVVRMIGEFKMEWIGFMLFRALRRQGVIAKDTLFDDDFLDGIEDVSQPNSDVEVVDDVDPSVPEAAID